MQPTQNPSIDGEYPVMSLLDVITKKHILQRDLINDGPDAPYATVGVKFKFIGGFRALPCYQSSKRNQLGILKSKALLSDVLAPYRFIWFEDFVFYHAGLVLPEGISVSEQWFAIPHITVSSFTLWRPGQQPVEVPTIAMSHVKGIWVC